MKLTAVYILIFILFAVTGCSDKKPTGSSGGGGTVTVEGTWGVVSVQTVVNDTVTVTATVDPDSSDRYLVIDGTSVMMYLLNTAGWYDQIDLLTGTYAGSLITTSSETLSVAQSGSQLLVAPAGAVGAATRYVYQRYTGSVPPGHWPSSYGSIDDDRYEPDDARNTATTLSAGETAQTHTLGSGDDDYFRIELQAGTMYRITLSDSVYDFSISYYDASGNYVYSYSSDSVFIETDVDVIEMTATKTMVLYVRIGNYYDGVAYAISMSTVAGDAYEDDDTLATANVLVSGQAAQSHTLFPGDDDWFSISVQSGLMYYIDLDVDVYDVYFSFFNASGVPLEGDEGIGISGGETYVVVTAGENATLYFRLRYDDVSEYSISLRSQAVQPVSFTGTYYLSRFYMAHSGTDTAYVEDTTYTSETTTHVIEVEANLAIMHIYFDFEYFSGTVPLVNLGGASVAWGGDTAIVTQEGEGIVLEFSGTGESYTYLERVTLMPYSGEVPPAAWTAGPPLPSNAVPLTVDGASVSAELSTSGEEDWYVFRTTSAVSHTIATTGGTDTKMSLYLLDGNSLELVDSDDDGGTDYNALITFTAGGSATYYAVITGYGGETGSYGISVGTGQVTVLKKTAEDTKMNKKLRSFPFMVP